MQNFKNMNNCCCTYGMKLGISILEELLSTEILIDNYNFYYSCGDSNGTIKKSNNPNLILLQEILPTNKIQNINICINNIDYIKIIPKLDQDAKIINELNKYYISPSILKFKCDEDCCCKESVASYMQDKYMGLDWSNRQFRIRLSEKDYMIPEDTDNFVTVIHMDYDIAWLWNQKSKVFYLVSLCKICALIDIE